MTNEMSTKKKVGMTVAAAIAVVLFLCMMLNNACATFAETDEGQDSAGAQENIVLADNEIPLAEPAVRLRRASRR